MEALWAELREGRGVVVLLRHARTVPGTGDPAGFQLDDCATQRNLSEAGREQARQIGVAFRAERVPVREVLSSQYCRCLDTAELLGLGPGTAAPMLNSFFGDRSTADAQTEELRQTILAHRERDGVMILVTHMVNIVAAAGVSPQQGEALVVRGTPQGSVAVLGRLLVDAGSQP
jgi:phosphohistidine phosphatase SixA